MKTLHHALRRLIRLTALPVFLAMSATGHADYQENLLVGWSFNNGTLLSDLGSLAPVQWSESGIGANQTTTFNPDGTVTLGTGRELYTTAINNTAFPGLADGLTLWAEVRLESVPGVGTTLLMGLLKSPVITATQNTTAIASFRGASSQPGVGYTGRVTDGTDTVLLHQDSGLSTIEKDEMFTVAIRFRELGGVFTYDTLINGVVKTGTLSPGSEFELQDFTALVLGRGLEAGGVKLTFNEVRLYDAFLSNGQIAAITAIPEPGSIALCLSATVVAGALARRRRIRY